MDGGEHGERQTAACPPHRCRVTRPRRDDDDRVSAPSGSTSAAPRCSVSCSTTTGTIVREVRRPSPVSELDALVEVCAAHRRRSRRAGAPRSGSAPPAWSTPTGRLTYAPNIPGVREAPLRRRTLASATGRAVVVDNDANVAALAEIEHGAAAGARHALMVTLGHRHRWRHRDRRQASTAAPNGFAGEIGHVTVERDGPVCACGELGHWEVDRERATRSAGWPASWSPTGGARRSSRPRAAISDDGERRRGRGGGPLGRRRGARLLDALRRQRRARSREPRQHPRPGAHRHRGRRGRHGCVAVRPVARRVRARDSKERSTGPRSRSFRPCSASAPARSAPRCSARSVVRT